MNDPDENILHKSSPLGAEGRTEGLETIILAGGLGTRLRNTVPDLPKCMAPVNGKPFLTYVIDYLQKEGIEKFIFALGHQSEVVEKFLASKLPSDNYKLSIETEPLGTGGAVKLACSKAYGNDVLVTNGDTLFKIDIKKLASFHLIHDADCTLGLRPLKNFERYGVVTLKDDFSIQSFKEKQFYTKGLINGGVYALRVDHFMNENLGEKFSFEKDYLEKYYGQRKMYGALDDGYFIDIGIPEDYKRAQEEMKNMG